MNINIEYADFADLDAVEQLYNDLNDTLAKGVNYPGWQKDIYPIRKDAAAGIENRSLFVARLDNKIVGSIILNHSPENGYHDVKWQYDGTYDSILVVHTLIVHPAFAKLGIGKQLLVFADNFGKKNHIRAIRLDVYENNTPAISLYESCGYQYMATIDLGYGGYGLEWFKLYEKLL